MVALIESIAELPAGTDGRVGDGLNRGLKFAGTAGELAKRLSEARQLQARLRRAHGPRT